MYTMTIHEMRNNPLTPIFPEDYPFYTDNPVAKKLFEEKFIQHYLLYEIGFKTPYVFQQMLYDKLLLNASYWKQLYETELRAKDIDFLLNKDLVEEFTRELSGIQNFKDTTTSTSNQSGNTTESSSSKSSNINDGVSSAKLIDGYLTNVASIETQTLDSTNASGSTNLNGNRDNRESETTRLVSKGNIGVTSSSQLLRDWRDVLINIDKIIIEECSDLFLKIY